MPLVYVWRRPIWRRALLSMAGVYLLFVIAPRLALFYVFFWILVWIAQNLVARNSQKPWASVVFWILVVLLLSPMVIWKLFPFDFVLHFNLDLHGVLWGLSRRLGSIDAVKDILLPVGLSFATFRAVDLLVQTHIGAYGRLSFDRVFFYGLFPPTLVLGPIIEYAEVMDEGVVNPPFDSNDLAAGVLSICVGFFKVFVLAYPLQVSSNVFSNPAGGPMVVWVSLFLFAWYFYFNFAGYSDIAIGAARLFGYRLKANFAFPYFKRDLQSFWASWHMSLTRFAQRNIYVPMGGFRKKTRNLALVATMMTIALWHDLSFSMVLFGLYHALGLCISRFLTERRKKEGKEAINLPVLQMMGTFLYVMLSFPLIMLPWGALGRFYGALVGM